MTCDNLILRVLFLAPTIGPCSRGKKRKPWKPSWTCERFSSTFVNFALGRVKKGMPIRNKPGARISFALSSAKAYARFAAIQTDWLKLARVQNASSSLTCGQYVSVNYFITFLRFLRPPLGSCRSVISNGQTFPLASDRVKTTISSARSPGPLRFTSAASCSPLVFLSSSSCDFNLIARSCGICCRIIK